jgi:DNA-binding CsgD family transcriptional regulator
MQQVWSQIDLRSKEEDLLADSTLLLLLGQIIESVDDGTTQSDVDRESPYNVLLDINLDGYRYVLLRAAPQPVQPRAKLSPREREIVRLITNGLPNKAIAAVLDISPWTVATHLRRIYDKLGVSSRAEMVARVLNGEMGSL